MDLTKLDNQQLEDLLYLTLHHIEVSCEVLSIAPPRFEPPIIRQNRLKALEDYREAKILIIDEMAKRMINP